MDEKKPSTADILAKIRAQKAGAASAPPTPAAEPQAAAPPAAEAASAPSPAADVPVSKPAAKPGSTKDILAAIRAKGAGGAAPQAAVSASAPAPTASVDVKAAPAGPRPSVQDMLKAVREGKVGAAAAPAVGSAAAKPVVAAPPMPARPVAVSKKAAQPRRGFLTNALVVLVFPFSTAFRLAWTCIAAVAGVATLGTARFMFPNVLVEPPSKFKVGPMSDYPLNTVSNKWKDQYGVWIVHTDQYEGRNLVFALASVCTHLGCTPSWLDGEQKFKCPCHGSGFYITGVNFEGPAPRPLERHGIRVAEGMLEVDKSVKFQEEMGQWTDAASFVELA